VPSSSTMRDTRDPAGAAGVSTVNVVGLGYVGAEICLAALQAGHRVAAIDVDAAKLDDLRRPAVDAALDEWAAIRAAIADGRLELHTGMDTAPRAGVWIVAVPTPLGADGKPDTTCIREAAQAIAPVVPANAVVVLESTSYPGTTEDVFLPPFLAAGWTPGTDLFVGFSPERINPGSRDPRMRAIPKPVSGCTEECLKTVAEFYRTIVDTVHPMSSTRAAEMTKLYENSWRLVNISLANENEQLCAALGLDPWEIAAACRTKPFGYHGFDPGPGAGGHCIPVDAGYLSHFAAARGIPTPVLDAAIATNVDRPSIIVQRVLDAVKRAAVEERPPRALLIGIAYKANVSDIRESAAVAVLRQLVSLGIEVDFHDPHVRTAEIDGESRFSVRLTPSVIAGYDCVVVLAAHAAVDWSIVRDSGRPVIDTRNALAAGESGR
jgi:UDP-N-acetyl-D-glucosamine dehydrogenase